MNLKWVIQNNLGKLEDHDKMIEACKKFNYLYESIQVIPFDDILPDIDNKIPTIFYGSTNFINQIYKSNNWKIGTFFNSNAFKYTMYISQYNENMLNYISRIIKLKDLDKLNWKDDELYFVRPNNDLKEFAGEVMNFGQLKEWYNKLQDLNSLNDSKVLLNLDTQIIISEPFNISDEWRLFIVNGKVSSGSHYRSYMKLDVHEDIPQSLIDYVEDMCKIWMPSQVFVMDVGMSNDKYYIIECNCFNSSGFYKSNIEKIIYDVSEYVKGL